MQLDLTSPSADNNSPLVPVISLSLFAIASGFLMSLIPLSLAALGLSAALAPWLASIFYGGLLGGALISAWVVSKLGHRQSLVAFLLLLVSSIVLMGFFALPAVWLISRFIAGIAVAGVFVAIESWLLIADTEKARAKRLGLYMAALYGGSASGQLGIGLFGTEGNLPLFIAALIMFSAILPVIFIKRGQPPIMTHSRINTREMRKLPSAAYIGCIVSGLLIGALYGLLPLALNADFSSEQVGALMAMVVLGGMMIQPLVSWLNSRIEKSSLMAMFSFLGLCSIAIIELSSHTAGIILGLFILGAAVFAVYPIAITLACQRLDTDKIVAATELMLLSYSVGSVLGPILAGKAFTELGSIMPYFLICFAATLLYMLLCAYRYPRRAISRGDNIVPSDN